MTLLPTVSTPFSSYSTDIQSVFAQSQYSDTLSLVELFEQSEMGVVSISVTKTSAHGDESSGVGSGFVFDKNGHIITNNHVVKDAKKIFVTFVDGTSYNAEIVGTDPYADLALVKINVKSEKLYPLSLGSSSELKVGEQIAAIGNPFGLSGSMTSGIVSQLGRILPSQGTGFSISDVIQTDTAINPGNSGGPLLNMNGEVVGINTAIYSTDGSFSGVGFSVPSDVAKKIIPFLIKDGQYFHPWIGVTTSNISPDLADALNLKEAKGVLIVTVVKNSPADKAGLRGSSQSTTVNDVEFLVGGDVVLSMDGNDVRKIDDVLMHLQREKSVGDKLNLGVLRDGQMINVVLTLEKRPYY
ncbi:MAG: trypsin-like serine protease [Nitrosopumilus sp.]|nr:trypsin-like serine protease [Nitrosopumilus sp.]